MKNNIAKYLVLPVLAGASLFSGCATTSENTSKNYKPVEKRDYAPISEAMEVLEAKSPRTVRDHNGYKFSIFDQANLRIAAGIYAGTVEAIKTDNGYLFRGNYSQFANPEAMDKVMEDADTNRDRIISRKEARGLTSKIAEESTK